MSSCLPAPYLEIEPYLEVEPRSFYMGKSKPLNIRQAVLSHAVSSLVCLLA